MSQFGIFEILYPRFWALLPYKIRYRITQIIERLRFRSNTEIPPSEVVAVCFSKKSEDALRSYQPRLAELDFSISNRYDLLVSCKNERDSILSFLKSIEKQRYLPEHILICDAGDDREVDLIIEKWSSENSNIIVDHFKRPESKIAEARNELAHRAESEILLFADLGTSLEETWVERILYPFEDQNIDVSMGWYMLEGVLDWQEELKKFISRPLEKTDVPRFLPSTRSIGIRKSAFMKTKGFNEDLSLAAEDSLFGYEIKRKGLKLAFSPDAVVHWSLPGSKFQMWKKLMKYAQGDAETGFLFWNHYIKQLILLAQIIFEISVISITCALLALLFDVDLFVIGLLLGAVSMCIRFYKYLTSFGPISSFARLQALIILVSAQMFGFCRGLMYLYKNKKLLELIDEYK